MGRKSKQAGSGHLPLTHYERQEYSKPYGTTTARLSGLSQYAFGQCALSLHPAKDSPVATHSGYIYERPAILEYLLTKTQELKQQQIQYDQYMQEQAQKEQDLQNKKRQAEVEAFETAQKVMGGNSNKKQKTVASAAATSTKTAAADSNDDDESNPLKRTSYWLAESQPELLSSSSSVGNTQKEPPPKRPPSPNSQRPLRRKDLIPLQLNFNTNNQVLCAISEKPIVSQQALALITKRTNDDNPAPVVLEKIFNDLNPESTKLCPVTGHKLTKLLVLQKGGSSFAGHGGIVEAKTYKPTMT